MMKELVLRSRSYRRFHGNKKISKKVLLELLDIARMTPCGGNAQLLRFHLSCTDPENDKIFSCLQWAAFLTDWDGPEKSERPSAYVLFLAPKNSNTSYSEGIVGQTLLLSATEHNLGGCFIANIDRTRLRQLIAIPEDYDIKCVIALGYPNESVVIEEIPAGENTHYYRDEDDVHHVPKIRLDDLII